MERGMYQRPQIKLIDLVTCLSQAVDLVSPMVVNHHYQVAYICLRLGQALDLPQKQCNDLVMAGALHDIGGLTLEERLICLDFEVADAGNHSEIGYLLLNEFQPFSEVARLVRFHHIYWNHGDGVKFQGHDIPPDCHFLHLADRVAVLVQSGKGILDQVEFICEKVQEKAGEMFQPELVEVFLDQASRESFWLDLVSPAVGQIITKRIHTDYTKIDMDRLTALAKLFSHIIDFRSRFTATHSSGVAASSAVLARFVGLTEKECELMMVAGYLHDLGKLAVPPKILEKSAQLDQEEFNIIKSHTYHTFNILDHIPSLDLVKAWAAFHHERMDGQGYPFRIKGQDLNLGSRIMAVADVFTALTEDRPYRQSMSGPRALEIIWDMAGQNALDTGIVTVLSEHFDEVNQVRHEAQAASEKRYRQLTERMNPQSRKSA